MIRKITKASKAKVQTVIFSETVSFITTHDITISFVRTPVERIRMYMILLQRCYFSSSSLSRTYGSLGTAS